MSGFTMYSRIIRRFILSSLLFPALAFSAEQSCDLSNTGYSYPACNWFSSSSRDCMGGVAVSSCPTSNLFGTCTYTASWGDYSSKIFWYASDNYFSASMVSAGNIPATCTGEGYSWSYGNSAPPGSSSPVASTPLPPPPTSQWVYLAPSGLIPESSVQVNAFGTYGSATLSVTLKVTDEVLTSEITDGSRSARSATAYNVYVIAMLPGSLVGSASPVLYVKPKVPAAWKQLEWPMAEFMSNVSSSAVNDQVVIDILENINLLGLIGAEIYVGYGTSDQEMLAASRYRGVYKVQ